jgi:predicted TIM-barrel fold metal-dependent hydrolase
MTIAGTKPVTRTIALEEAFLHPKLRALYPPAYGELLDMVGDRLTDVGPERIRRMDAAGIDLQVLSHVQPGVQTLDADTAVGLAREINDWLGEITARYPARFAGFATLAPQVPEAAADELERAVTKLGFKGALINGHTQGRYLDDEAFSVLFERAQALDVPIYIHPTDPPRAVIDTYYPGYPALVQAWGWQVETGTHLLRLMCGGVFDRYPRLQIIVGHMGELIPFHLKRINAGTSMGTWLLQARAGGAARPAGMERSVVSYMRQNVSITTSGVFDQVALRCAIDALGIDRILFSVDDPFGDNFEAVDFLARAELSAADRESLAHGNAERLLKLSPAASTGAGPPARRATLSAYRARAKARLARAMLSFLLK